MAIPNIGSGNAALAPVQASGTGTFGVNGSGSALLAAVRGVGTGFASPQTNVSGSGSATLAAVRGSTSSVGTIANSGTGNARLVAIRGNGVGSAKQYGIRPEDFCKLTAVLDADGEVIHYSLASLPAPTKLDDDGNTIRPEGVYALPARAAAGLADVYDLEEVEVTGTSAIHTKFQVSPRMSSICKWQTKVGDGDWISWLRHHGNGQQLAFNENYNERFGLGYAAGSIVHNPTFGGGISQFTDFLMPEAGYRLSFSPQLHYEATGGAIGTARVRASVIPMHWSPDGLGQSSGNTTAAEWDHGGETGVTDILFWDARQYYDVVPGYGGDEAVHRVSFWSYQRRGWDTAITPTAEPFYTSGATGGGTLVDLFNELYIVDVDHEDVSNVTPFLVSPYDIQADIYTSGLRLQVWNGPLAGVTWRATLVPSGYAACIFRRTSDDFCVAFAVKLDNDSDGARRPSRILVGTFRNLLNGFPGFPSYPGFDTTQDEAIYGPLFNAMSDDDHRASGWVGTSYVVVAGLGYAATLAKLYALHADGVFDLQPSTDLPAAATDGTVGIDADYYEPEVVAQTDAEVVWASVVASYDTPGLIPLTNISDRSATTVTTATGVNAAQNVIDLWPVYAQAAFDVTDVKQIEIAKQAVIAVLWRRGGSSTTIAEVKWTEVFADDGLIGRLRKMGARGRTLPSSNSGVSQKAERTSSGRQVRGWSDRDSLPTNYLPRTKPADNSED